MLVQGKPYRTVWIEGPTIHMINQPLIPHAFEITQLHNTEETAKAIETMIVRGAPAIGATGAYGMAQATLLAKEPDWKKQVEAAAKRLAKTRPTAQDLFHAIRWVQKAIENEQNIQAAREKAIQAAKALADSSAKACEKIGQYGETLIKDGARILTHCNAGWLACVDWGTALAPIYKATRNKKNIFVYADETRPRCQGARLTAWELAMEKIPHAIIADNAAGYYMARGEIDIVIVGTDRTVRNGDVANKIGTYTKAVLAARHGIPFYVAAPTTTIDLDIEKGDDIPIEHRDPQEVLTMFGQAKSGKTESIRIAPQESPAYNPAFDITPAELVTGIITEHGIIAPTTLPH